MKVHFIVLPHTQNLNLTLVIVKQIMFGYLSYKMYVTAVVVVFSSNGFTLVVMQPSEK